MDFSTERPVQAIPGYLAVAERVRREVSLGRLLPGDRLPPERQLAESLGVARETLRQALRLLESSGHVSIVRGPSGGAVIQEVRVDFEEFRRETSERIDQVLDLIDYRRDIESGAARLAAERRADAELEYLHGAQERLLAAQNKDEFRRADNEFHLTVASATRNSHYVAAVEECRTQMFLSFDQLPFEFALESSHESHGRILSAIERGLPTVAAEEMRDHIEHSRKELLKLIFD